MSPEKLGQHFLVESWQDRVEDAIQLDSGVWLEIGAGHGEMTSRLAQHASRVIAIELDRQLAPRLRNITRKLGNVEVVQADVLSADLAALTAGAKFSVYGNLPYYITSPILHRLFEHANQIQIIHIVIQYEVALRIAAAPGCSDYGYLSVLSQWYSHPEIEFRIPPDAFQPPPKVDSALMTLRMPGAKAVLPITNEGEFFEFVKECFAQKRKTLETIYGEDWERAHWKYFKWPSCRKMFEPNNSLYPSSQPCSAC